ncbi:phospholipase D-like domain-containing protein [Chloroflexota bacterium]
METRNSKIRDVLTGVVGFSIGGIAGNLFTYLIIISGFAAWLINLIPESQPIVRLLTAILTAFLVVAMGGAVTGVINALAIRRVDQEANRRKYLLGFAYAFAIGQGIFFIPTLLLISLISLYNNDPRTQPEAYLIFFGLLGLIYGLLIGILLSFMTVRIRYSWIVLLASILGLAIGGVLLGLVLYNVNLISGTSQVLKAILRLGVLSLMIYIPIGAALGLGYHFIAKKRADLGDEALEPSKWQPILVIVISLLVYLTVAGFIRQAEKFLVIRPGSTAAVLTGETVGTHWSSPIESIGEIGDPSASPLSISANSIGVIAIGLTQATEASSDIFYGMLESDQDNSIAATDLVNVSNSALGTSSWPGIVVDSEGAIHIAWEEIDSDSGDSHILYSSCKNEICTNPHLLSELSNLSCAADATGENNRWPAIAIDKSNQLMVTWSTSGGIIAYATWAFDESPPETPTGCVSSSGSESVQTQLAGGSEGVFALTFAANEPGKNGDINLVRFQGDNWDTPGTEIGYGKSPDVIIDNEDQFHVTWCGENQETNYQINGGQTEQIISPSCTVRPLLGIDADNQPHIIWYSDEVTNLIGFTSPSTMLYESIRTDDGWSSPAIVTQTAYPNNHALATQYGGNLHLVWLDAATDQDSIHYAQQETYHCEVDSLSVIGQQALAAIEAGDFHPPDYEVPYCDNRYIDFIYQPNPDPAFTDQPPAPNGGFDRVAELAATAEYEVLFTVMQWDQDENDLNPGSTMARGVAELYKKIKENPELYPRGLSVRILLGNYPTLSTLQWGDQIWNVLEDLRDEGVDEMENVEIGWKVEVANFEGTYPHAHTKFMIVDGKVLMGAGFNYGWLHYSREHPSGKGDNLVDLAMVLSGPVAQAAISAYDDMWVDGNQLHCTDFYPEDGTSWTETCTWSKASGGHLPEVMKYYQSDRQHNAFSLYRSSNYKEADSAYGSVFASAQSSIDAIHVNFSLELICFLNLIVEDLCNFDNALQWMDSMMNAVEQNQVTVRVIVEESNSNGMENRIAIDVFEKELANRGLEDLVEVRFFNGRVHTKSALIDQEFLIVGSQNLHYSSWGERGLLEYGVATDDPEAILQYQKMFDYYWEQAIPVEEAD